MYLLLDSAHRRNPSAQGYLTDIVNVESWGEVLAHTSPVMATFVGMQCPVNSDTNAHVYPNVFSLILAAMAERAHHSDPSARSILLLRAGGEMQMNVDGIGELERVLVTRSSDTEAVCV